MAKKKMAAPTTVSGADALEEILAELRGGPVGVAKWNSRSVMNRISIYPKLNKQDFCNAKLAGVDFSRQPLGKCKFDGADLSDANLCDTILKEASFQNATLNGSNLGGSKCNDASFEGASVTHCKLRGVNFLRCIFHDADLTGADFSYSNLQGADLSTAVIKGVTFFKTKFDETTKFPKGFKLVKGLVWKGNGPHPHTKPPPPALASGSLGFEDFLKKINEKIEAARVEKASEMLQAESFHLFAEVKDDSLIGIVRSQSSAGLAYSCRLVADGAFSCCTQNLRPCGGLRGSLCKHLLVLIIGLAKAKQIDPATVDNWINLSRGKKPAIDQDVMSATFLRYKGAEAGEIDWRPTETIPEDFYAM